MWYKFQGGKNKIHQKEAKKKNFFKKHPGLKEFLEKIYEFEFKEIARGNLTTEDIQEAVKEKFNIDMPNEYLDI